MHLAPDGTFSRQRRVDRNQGWSRHGEVTVTDDLHGHQLAEAKTRIGLRLVVNEQYLAVFKPEFVGKRFAEQLPFFILDSHVDSPCGALPRNKTVLINTISCCIVKGSGYCLSDHGIPTLVHSSREPQKTGDNYLQFLYSSVQTQG